MLVSDLNLASCSCCVFIWGDNLGWLQPTLTTGRHEGGSTRIHILWRWYRYSPPARQHKEVRWRIIQTGQLKRCIICWFYSQIPQCFGSHTAWKHTTGALCKLPVNKVSGMRYVRNNATGLVNGYGDPWRRARQSKYLSYAQAKQIQRASGNQRQRPRRLWPQSFRLPPTLETLRTLPRLRKENSGWTK